MEMTVLTTDTTGELPRYEEVEGVVVRRVVAFPKRSDYYFAPRVFSEIAKAEADIIHVQSYQTLVAPIAMLAARSAHLPYVVTFHAGGHSSRVRARLRPLQLGLLRPLLRHADRLVALAPFEVDEYAERLRVSTGRFVVIPNGSDLPGASEFAAVPREDPLIASIGRLERYKGHHRVLLALPHLLVHRPETRLWIAGKGPDEEWLRRLAESLGVAEHVEIRAIPPQNREQLAKELSRVRVVVSLSEFETQPIAALEAAALGCRLVVADSPGLRALAEGDLARSVPLDSTPEQVATAVLSEMELPPRSPPPRLPTWDDCTEALLDLYRSVFWLRMNLRAAGGRS
jgi:glycogen synthase